MFVAYYVWNVTENVCISRTDDYAIILYILVALAFLELRHIFFWSCLKTLLTVAWFRNVLEGVFIEESHIFERVAIETSRTVINTLCWPSDWPKSKFKIFENFNRSASENSIFRVEILVWKEPGWKINIYPHLNP